MNRKTNMPRYTLTLIDSTNQTPPIVLTAESTRTTVAAVAATATTAGRTVFAASATPTGQIEKQSRHVRPHTDRRGAIGAGCSGKA